MSGPHQIPPNFQICPNPLPISTIPNPPDFRTPSSQFPQLSAFRRYFEFPISPQIISLSFRVSDFSEFHKCPKTHQNAPNLKNPHVCPISRIPENPPNFTNYPHFANARISQFCNFPKPFSNCAVFPNSPISPIFPAFPQEFIGFAQSVFRTQAWANALVSLIDGRPQITPPPPPPPPPNPQIQTSQQRSGLWLRPFPRDFFRSRERSGPRKSKIRPDVIIATGGFSFDIHSRSSPEIFRHRGTSFGELTISRSYKFTASRFADEDRNPRRFFRATGRFPNMRD